MEGQTIPLWTRQVTQVWQTLQDDGVYFCKEAYIREKNDTIADYYLELYRWFTWEAGKYIAVPTDEADAEGHRRELAQYGIRSDDELIKTHKGNFYPRLRSKIQKSWGRVFTQTQVAPEMLAATMWELRKEWVKEVRFGEAVDNPDR